jgi:thiol-disulfide isomerase/thioredoxin
MYSAVHAICLAAAVAWLVPALPAQPKPSYKSNPKFKTALSDAKLLADNQDYDDAIASYQEANDIADGRCSPCLRAVIELQIQNGDYDEAIASARAFKTFAVAPADKSFAEASRGRALFLQSEPEKTGSPYNPDLLHAADAAFKSALALDPENSTALFKDGQVLAHLGQTEAARAQFNACLASIKPGNPIYLRAQRFAANPALARAQLAPSFTVKTLDGSSFSLDRMQGRVVLIDFWATWCVPCMKELPQIKQIAKDFAGQPLVILSVSWDEDEQTWKDFVRKNQMTWPQYRDTDHRLGQLFEVEAIPSYYTIDSDGVITSELLGEGFDVEGRLRKLIAQTKAAGQNKALAATAR